MKPTAQAEERGRTKQRREKKKNKANRKGEDKQEWRSRNYIQTLRMMEGVAAGVPGVRPLSLGFLAGHSLGLSQDAMGHCPSTTTPLLKRLQSIFKTENKLILIVFPL